MTDNTRSIAVMSKASSKVIHANSESEVDLNTDANFQDCNVSEDDGMVVQWLPTPHGLYS